MPDQRWHRAALFRLRETFTARAEVLHGSHTTSHCAPESSGRGEVLRDGLGARLGRQHRLDLRRPQAAAIEAFHAGELREALLDVAQPGTQPIATPSLLVELMCDAPDPDPAAGGTDSSGCSASKPASSLALLAVALLLRRRRRMRTPGG